MGSSVRLEHYGVKGTSISITGFVDAGNGIAVRGGFPVDRFDIGIVGETQGVPSTVGRPDGGGENVDEGFRVIIVALDGLFLCGAEFNLFVLGIDILLRRDGGLTGLHLFLLLRAVLRHVDGADCGASDEHDEEEETEKSRLLMFVYEMFEFFHIHILSA